MVDCIIDSDMTLQEALGGKRIPCEITAQLRILCLRYWSLDGRVHKGQLIVHQSLVLDVVSIFEELWEAKFPIARMIPISAYDWNDRASMAANNTSAFNYRKVSGKNRLSQHAYGRAIDINPRFNPYVKGRYISPRGATRDAAVPGTILDGGPVVRAFERRGWVWGGRWTTCKDWHHFQKPTPATGPT